MSKQSIVLRDWLRSANFVKNQALVAEIGNGIFIRSSVYQSKDERVRAQVLFIPMSNGSLSANVSFSSDEEGGRRLVTDNLFMPYGGFYPENWEVHRKPWIRSAKTLYNVHAKYIRNRDLQPFEVDPIDDLNQQQSLLERTNVNEGFLVPLHLQEEYGRITWEGRYRVWKEVWLLNYFGIANRA